MEFASKESVKFDDKKIKRVQAKKRKIEALLNLFDSDKSILPRAKKQDDDSLSNSYKALKDELKKFAKKPEVEPCLYLTHLGKKSAVIFKNYESYYSNALLPICTEDVYHLLLKSVIGHFSTQPLEWVKLEQPQNLTKTVLIVVTGLAASNLLQNIARLNNIELIFPHAVKIMTPNISFAKEMSTIHLITDFHIQTPDSYSTMFPSEKEVKIETVVSEFPLTKLHLLLSPIQLVMENYPLPQSVFQFSKSSNYVFTKKEYQPVTPESPMFAVDCEMCATEANPQELTRIAVVDENLQTVYHSFVKPKAKITDYLTRFSGITPQMMADVETNLKDVQSHLRTLLPPNAILCGHSLNNDLHALKMIHPYVIDTSLIYNNTGVRGKKCSLKNLTKLYLCEDIQNNKSGHDPTEDSQATMKLVQLKLQNSITFGDKCFENGPDNCNGSGKKTGENSNNLADSSTKPVSPPNSNKEGGFFQQTEKYKKKICLIGDEAALGEYWSEVLTDNVHQIAKPTNKKIVKALANHLADFDMIVTHLNFLKTESIVDSLDYLNNVVKDVYDSLDSRTLFAVHMSGVDPMQFEDIKSGLFMAEIKKS